MNTLTGRLGGNPPVHPVAWHAGPVQEGKRIGEILTNAVSDFRTWLKLVRQRRIDRQAFQHMLALDDKLLGDIGVSRADVIWANSLPLSQNASLELDIIAKRNRKRR